MLGRVTTLVIALLVNSLLPISIETWLVNENIRLTLRLTSRTEILSGSCFSALSRLRCLVLGMLVVGLLSSSMCGVFVSVTVTLSRCRPLQDRLCAGRVTMLFRLKCLTSLVTLWVTLCWAFRLC